MGSRQRTMGRKIITLNDTLGQVQVDEPGALPVIIPADDPKAMSLLDDRTCLSCRHHDRERFKPEARSFFLRMLHDERYRREWFNDLGKWGFCDIFEGRAVYGDAPAVCAASDLDTSLTPGSKDGMVHKACPHYADRRKAGEKLSISRSGKRTVSW